MANKPPWNRLTDAATQIADQVARGTRELTDRATAFPLLSTTAQIAAVFPNTPPLGILDASQFDSETPGVMEGSLRHDEGEHENGQDFDVAYYQSNSDNRRRAICENDGERCTADPHRLDTDRTATFLKTLRDLVALEQVRVDPLVLPLLTDAEPTLAEVLSSAPRHFDRIHIRMAQ